MPLTNPTLQPTLEYQQLKFEPGKHLWSRGVFQCVSHDVSRVVPPAGGHQVDVPFSLQNKACKYFA